LLLTTGLLVAHTEENLIHDALSQRGSSRRVYWIFGFSVFVSVIVNTSPPTKLLRLVGLTRPAYFYVLMYSKGSWYMLIAMNHLSRISAILGGLLVIASAYVVASQRSQPRKQKVPVEQLAESLKQAWAGRHIP
jgi:hypothetical protein